MISRIEFRAAARPALLSSLVCAPLESIHSAADLAGCAEPSVARGRNQILGDGAVVGTRVWDQQGSFVIELGPLKQTEFLDFLPIGIAYKSLCELTRFYAGTEFEFAFRLALAAAEIPETRLGQSRLGWTSWLKTRPFGSDNSQVHLRPPLP